jgi:SHS2 domain-containing protein
VGRWTVLEEIAVADCALEIEGDSLDDLFETAARALCELMVDPATVAPTVERTVSLGAGAVDLLFYDWLSELIFLKDRDREVFIRTKVRVTTASPWRLAARLDGGIIDPERTALRADPKAVTFHRFAVEETGTGWRARVVIDI